MATKQFNARISLKYDTYANWVDKNPVLLAGEAAVAVVPASTGAVQQEPAVLIKIGDGTKTYNDLPFISGKAADVYTWALQPNKPTYTANEISGLADYISGKVQDTNTTYKIDVDPENPRKFTLKAKELGSVTWTDISTVTIPVSALTTGSTNGTVNFNGTDVAVKGLGSAAYENSTAFDVSGAASAVLGNSSDESTANTVYGVKALANTKVSSVGATANKGIEIGETATSPTVGIKLDSTAGNAATLSSKGLMVTPGVVISTTQPTADSHPVWINPEGITDQYLELRGIFTPVVKNTMDEVAQAGVMYCLGEQTAVTIPLPDNADVGQMISVVWYNGSAAATLSITGTMLPCDYAPSANSRSEVNALWDGRYWAIVAHEMEVPA